MEKHKLIGTYTTVQEIANYTIVWSFVFVILFFFIILPELTGMEISSLCSGRCDSTDITNILGNKNMLLTIIGTVASLVIAIIAIRRVSVKISDKALHWRGILGLPARTINFENIESIVISQQPSFRYTIYFPLKKRGRKTGKTYQAGRGEVVSVATISIKDKKYPLTVMGNNENELQAFLQALQTKGIEIKYE